MKTTIMGLFMGLVFMSCQAQTNDKKQVANTESSNKIEVYYFHYTHRCVTCNAVEEVTRQALKEYYGDKLVVVSLNLDEKEAEAKGKQLNVEGQSLFIIKGNQQFNLTNDAFMNARSNPGKLKTLIKKTIDPLM